MSGGRVPDDVWRSIVEHVPIVSVDLVVRDGDEVVLGRRRNEPAKGERFVPGGRLEKHEGLEEAVRRVGRAELGVEVTVQRRLGVYEHRYDIAEFDDVGGKHYVPVGYVVTPVDDEFAPDGQHERFERFAPPFEDIDLHPYVEQYLADAGMIDATDD